MWLCLVSRQLAGLITLSNNLFGLCNSWEHTGNPSGRWESNICSALGQLLIIILWLYLLVGDPLVESISLELPEAVVKDSARATISAVGEKMFSDQESLPFTDSVKMRRRHVSVQVALIMFVFFHASLKVVSA